MSHTSAIPDVYYAIFAFYEPFLTIVGLVGTFYNPKSAHDQQAPWPSGRAPPGPLPLATFVTILQLAHVCALLGVVNFFVLSAARQYLRLQPALQEKLVSSLLTPLLIGDILHIYITLWALGDQRWQVTNWGAVLWSTILLGFSLLIPRIAWHLGIGRFVDKRDGRAGKSALDKH